MTRWGWVLELEVLEMYKGWCIYRPRQFPLLLRGHLTAEYEWSLYFRNIHIGADGSVIFAGDAVYVLFTESLEHRVDRIEQFANGVAVMPSGWYWPASKMIPIDRPGYVVKRIIAFQRIWKIRRRRKRREFIQWDPTSRRSVWRFRMGLERSHSAPEKEWRFCCREMYDGPKLREEEIWAPRTWGLARNVLL